MPLRSDGTVVAVLIVDYGTPRAFDPLERTGSARVSGGGTETMQRLRERAATSVSASQSRDGTARDATMQSLQRRVADLELALQRGQLSNAPTAS